MPLDQRIQVTTTEGRLVGERPVGQVLHAARSPVQVDLQQLGVVLGQWRFRVECGVRETQGGPH